MDVIFLDSGREPKCKPDPAFPDGVHVNLASPTQTKVCCTNVPYPAPRCGAYVLTCEKCGNRVSVTVAGRADDPRSVTMPCKSGVV
jgi:hypothetical protein